MAAAPQIQATISGVQIQKIEGAHREIPCPQKKISATPTAPPLQESSPYLFRIAHCSKLLSAPSDVAATASGQDVTVTWAPPTVGGNHVNTYEVWRLDSVGTSTRIGSQILSISTSFLDSNVSGDPATYQYRVRAVDQHGHPGPFSHHAAPGQITPPSITSPPSNVTVDQGNPVTFSVTAVGSEPLSYQWQQDGQDIPGETSASYTIPQTALADDGKQFSAVVTNAANSATSSSATLTITPVTIFYQESGGSIPNLVSLEAEHLSDNISGQEGSQYNDHQWELMLPTPTPESAPEPLPDNASGEAGMVANPKNDTPAPPNGYNGLAPQLDWRIKFKEAGTYYVWIRGKGQGNFSDSVHFGLDNVEIATGYKVDGFNNSDWDWENTLGQNRRTLEINSIEELHTFHVWMREDGFILDKIVMTTDPNYVPTGLGPAETPTVLDEEPPTPPENVQVTTVSPSELSVGWDPATDDVGITEYEVQRCEGGGPCGNPVVFPGVVSPFQDNNNLFPATTYWYDVIAKDGSGKVSAPAGNSGTTDPDNEDPSQPMNVTGNASGTVVTLTWLASIDNVGLANYEVQRCTGPGCTDFLDFPQMVSVPPLPTKYEDNAVAPNTTYRYRVVAKDIVGNSSVPGESSDITTNADGVLPTAPGNVHVAVISHSELTVSWDAATDAGGIQQYQVKRCQGTNCQDYGNPQFINAPTTEYADAGLEPLTVYRYEVLAMDPAGNWGPPAFAEETTPQEDIVAFFQYEEGPDYIVSIEAENPIHRSFPGQAVPGGNPDYSGHAWTEVTTPAGPSGGKAMEASPNDEENGMDSGYSDYAPQLVWDVKFSQTGIHYVWVRGWGVNGTSDSVHIGLDGEEVTTSEKITDFGSGQWKWGSKSGGSVRTINITNTEDVHTIHAWMREDGFILDKIVLTTNPNYEPTGLGPEESPTILDIEPPSPPENVLVTPISASELSVSWSPASDNVGVTEYEVRRCEGAAPCASPVVFPGVISPFQDNHNLLPSTTYWYDVVAKDDAGNVGNPAGNSGTTNPDEQDPDPPTGVEGTASGTVVTLTWTASQDNVGVVGYEIQRCTGPNCTDFSDFVQAMPAPGPMYEDHTVSASTTYRYQVVAKDAAGNSSSPGESDDVTTLSDGERPSAPVNVQVTPVSHSELTVTWEPATDNVGIQEYEIRKCLDPSCITYEWFVVGTTPPLTRSFLNLLAATTYRYEVRALDTSDNWGDPAIKEGTTYEEPVAFFVETGGVVSMEAEHYHGREAGKVGIDDYTNHQWQLMLPVPTSESAQDPVPSGAAGEEALTTPDLGAEGPNAGQYVGVSPRVDWRVKFNQAGTYYVWVRGHGQGGTSDSFHMGLNGKSVTTTERMQSFGSSAWTWSNQYKSGTGAKIEVPATGWHTINAWMREDGFILDKIVLTTDVNFDPTIPDPFGPSESVVQLDAVPPSTPAPTAINVGVVGLTVDWEPSSDDIQVSGYTVSRCTGAGCTDFVDQVSGMTGTDYQDYNLTRDTTYRYQVVAHDVVGHTSEPGILEVTTLQDQSAPTAPSPVGIDYVSGSNATIMWTPSQDDGQIVAYDVRRCVGTGPCTSNDLVRTVRGATYTFTDSGLQAAISYRYEIVARDSASHESSSASVIVTTANDAPPAAVVNGYPVDGAMDISRYPTLETTCNVANIKASQYLIGTDSQMSTPVYDSGETPNDVCSHVALAALSPATQYYWQMRMKNDQGEWSAWSIPTSFTTNNTSIFINVFQDDVAGYAGTRDADIRGDGIDPTGPPIRDWDQGAQNVLRTGRRPPGSPSDEIYRSLLKFDVTSLTDSNAVVTAYIEMTGWEHDANDYHLAPNSMYEMIRPWQEGDTIENEDVGPGEVSWTSSIHPDTWAINGAGFADDSDPNADRRATPAVKLVAPNQVGFKTLWSSQALVNAVKNWIADPNTNQGFLIQADDEGIKAMLNLASREHDKTPYHPRLVIVSSEHAFQGMNQPPVAVVDTIGTTQGAAVFVPVLSNDFDPDNGPSGIQIVEVEDPTNGTAEIFGESIRYTPDPSFVDQVEDFSYTISDGTDQVSAMIRVTVTGPVPLNQPPTAVNDSYSLVSGGALIIDQASGVLANDTDPESPLSLTAIVVGSPSNGVLALNPDGSFTYTPNVGFGGTDSFQYQADDQALYSPPATVTLSINGQPQTVNDTANVLQDADVEIAVLDNDTDDGTLDPATVTIQGSPMDGTATVDTVTGKITYDPNGGYWGTDSFTYTVNDDQGYESLPATVTVEVIPSSNIEPTTVSDAYSVNQDNMLSITGSGVLANDSDPNQDPLTAILDSSVSNGTLTLNTDGSFIHTPNVGFSGTDSFTYHAHDGALDSQQATVTITINGRPVANDDSAITLKDAAVVIDVISNDTDDQPVVPTTVAIVSGPNNGTASVNSTGEITYTPNTNFLGSDSLTYTIADTAGLVSLAATVTIQVTDGNVPPVVADDIYDGNQENPIIVTAPGVLVNDSDLNHDPMTASLITNPNNGTVTLNADGSFTYIPNSGFNGEDRFTYVTNDGTADSTPATVTLSIAPPLGATFQDGTAGYAETVDTFLRGAAPANSHGGQDRVRWNINEDKYGLIRFDNIFVSEGGPIPNEVTIHSATLTLDVSEDGDAADIYESEVDWSETETFDSFGGESGVQAADLGALVRSANGETIGFGALVLDVKASLERWVADPSSNHGWVFVPTGTQGVDVRSRSYATITERPRLDVTYTLGMINHAPVVNDDSYTGNQGVELTMTAPGVLGNDTDANNDPLTAVLDSNPSNGTLTLNADGSLTYTPNTGFSGTDSFTYYAHDGELDSPVATATLNINGQPIAANDSATTLQDVAVEIEVLNNDTDDNNQLNPATVTVASAPTHGTTSVDSGTGKITYTPDTGYLGADAFMYTVADTGGLVSAAATVSLDVTNANLPPVVTDDGYTGNQDTPLTIAAPGVLSNDSDPNNDPLTAALATNPSNGTVTLNADGSLTYTPNAGFSGNESFTYVANDGTVNSASATVTLTIVPPVTVTFQDGTAGYAETVDTFLRGAAPANSHGGQDRVRWNINEDKYGLIRFDNIFVSEGGPIPNEVTIHSATLTLDVSEDGDAADIYESAVDWSETATFDSFGGESGVQADDLGALVRSANGETIGFGALVLDVKASLERWVADPSSNHGWVFVPTGTQGVDVRSRSYATITERPRLDVTYTLSQ